MTFVVRRRFPVAPLMAVLGADSEEHLAVMVGTTKRSVSRWKAEGGIPDRTVDEILIGQGICGESVYDDWLWTPPEVPEPPVGILVPVTCPVCGSTPDVLAVAEPVPGGVHTASLVCPCGKHWKLTVTIELDAAGGDGD